MWLILSTWVLGSKKDKEVGGETKKEQMSWEFTSYQVL
jgi:hypothetical protein